MIATMAFIIYMSPLQVQKMLRFNPIRHIARYSRSFSNQANDIKNELVNMQKENMVLHAELKDALFKTKQELKNEMDELHGDIIPIYFMHTLGFIMAGIGFSALYKRGN